MTKRFAAPLNPDPTPPLQCRQISIIPELTSLSTTLPCGSQANFRSHISQIQNHDQIDLQYPHKRLATLSYNSERILMLGLLSFISYLHITGIFAKIYEVYSRRRSANGETEPNAPADPNAPGAAAAAGAAIVNRYGVLARVLRISADRGFVQDVKYFVVGLLLSLVPAWHPQPIQGAVPMPENAMPDDVPLQGI